MNDQMKPAVPEGVKGWSWGAFLLTWIWGIGNGVWISFLVLVPCLGVIWPFVLGFKGNEWAWQKRNWESVEEFKRVQKKWAIAGLIVFVCILALISVIMFTVSAAIKKSDVYQEALMKAKSNPAVVMTIGEPMEDGIFPSGNIEVENGTGTANLSFTLKGPKGKGTVMIDATKAMGKWRFNGLVFVPKGSTNQISLLP